LPVFFPFFAIAVTEVFFVADFLRAVFFFFACDFDFFLAADACELEARLAVFLAVRFFLTERFFAMDFFPAVRVRPEVVFFFFVATNEVPHPAPPRACVRKFRFRKRLRECTDGDPADHNPDITLRQCNALISTAIAKRVACMGWHCIGARLNASQSVHRMGGSLAPSDQRHSHHSASMYTQVPSSSAADGLRIGLVVSRYHKQITDALYGGAVKHHEECGGRADDLVVAQSPGAYELVAICRALAHEGDYDAIIALGCIITGDTMHDQYIAGAVSQGLMNLTIETGVPIAFGVLTCKTIEQAQARAGGDKGNKGAEAMAAAIEAANAIRAVRRHTLDGDQRGGSR
jgi:6,7-dimethyl-8-ribityllumazine synthase